MTSDATPPQLTLAGPLGPTADAVRDTAAMYDPALMFTVVIAEKDGAERRVTFAESEVTIGRVPGNDVVLPKGNVSKRHSRIVLKDNRFIVVDLKSTNGTYVNGRKITSPLVVKEGDKIYVGDYVLTLEGAPELDALRPPSLLPNHTLSESSAEQLGAARSGRDAIREAAREASEPYFADEHLPAVLRGTQQHSSLPATNVASASEMPKPSPSQLAEEVHEGEPILAAESELELFEERSAREQARTPAERPAPAFPPALDGHSPEPLVLGTRVAPQADLRSRAEEPHASTRLLGPVEGVLDDPSVFHVVVERFDRIRADRGRGLELEAVSFASPAALVRVAHDVRTQAGVPSNAASYDVSLANGLQVVAVLPAAASSGAVLSIRRRPTHLLELSALEPAQLSVAARARIEDAIAHKRHVWVVGASGLDLSGMLASTLSACPASERVALFERAPEVALGERSAICLKHGVVAIGELLERVRSFRPDRLVFHGLREDDLSLVLDRLAQRPEGTLASFEARSAKDALAAFNRSIGPDLTLRAVSLLIELKRADDGKSAVSAVFEIELGASGELTLIPV